MRPLRLRSPPHSVPARHLSLGLLRSRQPNQVAADGCASGLCLGFLIIARRPPPFLLYPHLLLALRRLLDGLPHDAVRSKDAVRLRSEGRALLQGARIRGHLLSVSALDPVGVGRFVKLRIEARSWQARRWVWLGVGVGRLGFVEVEERLGVVAVGSGWVREGGAGHVVEVGLLEVRLLEAEVADGERRDAGEVRCLAEGGQR